MVLFCNKDISSYFLFVWGIYNCILKGGGEKLGKAEH